MTGETGDADFHVPLSAPRGRGSLHVVARMSGDRWIVDQAVITVLGSAERINLLEQQEGAQ